jgi:hypothetical protein
MAARIALLVVGLAVWGYGARVDDSQLRLIGIALLALSLVLRFFKPRTPRDSQDGPA